MRFYKYSLSFILLLALNGCGNSTEQGSTKKADENTSAYPVQRGSVNDFEDILSEEAEENLSSRLDSFKEITGNEMVIITLDTIPVEDPVFYAAAIGNEWGVGSEDSNNGLIILISEHTRQVGIATGKDVEQLYSDSICDYAIRKNMIPYFAVGDYAGGLQKSVHYFRSISQ